MKIKPNKREKLWITAKRLHPSLGAPFQNEYDLSQDDILDELARADEIGVDLEHYKSRLRKML